MRIQKCIPYFVSIHIICEFMTITRRTGSLDEFPSLDCVFIINFGHMETAESRNGFPDRFKCINMHVKYLRTSFIFLFYTLRNLFNLLKHLKS